MLFKLEDNVPDVYVLQSRDFLLLCKIYDVILNNNIQMQSKIMHLLDTNLVNDSLIKLMCYRLGFYHDEYIPTDVLRHILQAFPYIIKNKGNRLGILQAVMCVIRQQTNIVDCSVTYSDSVNADLSVILIDLKVDNYTTDLDLSYLKDVLKYVVPVGCQVKAIVTQLPLQLAQSSNKRMLRVAKVFKPKILRQEYLRF